MAISVYDWGSVLEQLQAGNQEFKPNFSKAMKIKSQIASQELKRETRWWYRLRRQRGSGGCVCMRVFVIKICVAVSVLVIGKGELCFWSSSLKCTVPLLPFYCTTILLYYFCPHCEYHCSYLTVCALICVFESTCHWKRGRVAPIAAYYCSYCNSSTYLQYCSHPILFALSIVSIVSIASIVSVVCILLPLIWERPGLPQLQCGHFRKQKKENILPPPILANNNLWE